MSASTPTTQARPSSWRCCCASCSTWSPATDRSPSLPANYFECMKSPFLGKNGHIAMRTPDLKAAMEELEENGFRFRMETAAYFEDGRIKNVYLEGEYGGFAIHIMQK